MRFWMDDKDLDDQDCTSPTEIGAFDVKEER